ncbi:hypothetical protein PPL_04318 [Heterostelium album PN500]|uniref:Terpene synthase n=1 Tax=Heterostelium pallidum (strain ATCC 26659 / Pp 5 / PN500) TaxID=670386 RepID=D3B783_HETP5|nr:hypothetical protein PPL_04318 [Heterostelium album PN500]EFA82626.1 hypothetical protein PPL_04318 [Heterostelium album PN500]|eukprot:XP_020434743.1 hypothetical protein PPL_04318 [Heterostelium album PN500]
MIEKIDKFCFDKENREKYLDVIDNVSSFARHMWPTLDPSQLSLGAQYMFVAIIFDDFIETCERKIEDNPTPLENLAMDLNQSLTNVAGTQHSMNLLKTAILDFIDNVIPFENMKSLEGDINMDLYYLLRGDNVGIRSHFRFSLIFVVKRLNSEIMSDPLWKYLVDNIGNICAIFNDITSYEKELRENDVRMNSFHFIKTQHNMCFEECMEYCEKEIDYCYDQYFMHEKLIIQKIVPTLKDKEEVEEFYKVIEQLHNITSSVIAWALESTRFKSKNSMFVELQLSD